MEKKRIKRNKNICRDCPKKVWGRDSWCSYYASAMSYDRDNWDVSVEKFVPEKCHMKLEHTVLESRQTNTQFSEKRKTRNKMVGLIFRKLAVRSASVN